MKDALGAVLGRIVSVPGGEVPLLPPAIYPFTGAENERFKEVHAKLDAINAKLDQLLSGKKPSGGGQPKKAAPARKKNSHGAVRAAILKTLADGIPRATFEIYRNINEPGVLDIPVVEGAVYQELWKLNKGRRITSIRRGVWQKAD